MYTLRAQCQPRRLGKRRSQNVSDALRSVSRLKGWLGGSCGERQFLGYSGVSFSGQARFGWGGRPVLGGSTSPGQLLDAAATGDVGADRRLRRRAAVQNSPPGRRNQIQNTTNSPPTRGIFRDIRLSGGVFRGPAPPNRASPVTARISANTKVYI